MSEAAKAALSAGDHVVVRHQFGYDARGPVSRVTQACAYAPGAYHAKERRIAADAGMRAPLIPDLMNATTVSCSGKDITIACNNHATKDRLIDILGGSACGLSPNATRS